MLSYRAILNQPHIAPYPYLFVRITDEIKNLQFGPFGAMIDSGADYTCIPSSITDPLAGSYNYEQEAATDFKGNIVSVDVVRILLAAVELLDQQGNVLLKKRFQNLKLPIAAEGLLGRDILNATICNLDGPTLVCSLK